MAVTIKPIHVENKKELEAFLHLPWKIYKKADGQKNPNWVPPFLDDQRSLLNPVKNPFHQHSRNKLFMAFNDKNELVGRISASVDDNFINFHNEKTGFFGWFECVNDFS